ncbi:hypothetical protein BHM03_00017003 [Ensete ventricosum]|nr:hypothetical protein BHM03_00017003 [Ensete ventricosum]
MLGQSQVWASGRGSDDAVGTRREIVGSSPKVSRACWEFTGSSLKVSRALWEFVGSSPKVSRVRQELAEGDQELARMASGVRRKKTKRHVENRELPKSLPGVRRVLLDLMDILIIIN